MTITLAEHDRPESAALEAARRLALAVIQEESAGHYVRPETKAAQRGKVGKAAKPTKRTAKVTLLSPVVERHLERLKRIDGAALELKKALNSRDQLSRCAAAYGIYRLKPGQIKSTVKLLVSELMVNMAMNMRIPHHLLMEMGAPTVPHLAALLDKPMVIGLLGMMGSEAAKAVPSLKALLGDDNVEVAVVLAQIGTKEAREASIPVLQSALDDPYFYWRKMALVGLAHLGADALPAAPKILELVSDPHAENRAYAALALVPAGRIDDAVAAMANLAGETELRNRHLVLTKLAHLGEQAQAAVPALIVALTHDSDRRVGDRALAAVALSRIAPSRDDVMSAIRRAGVNAELRQQLQEVGLVL